MWKNILYFTKSQRIGIIALIVLILLAFSINIFFSNKQSHAVEVEEDFYEGFAEFQEKLKEKEKFSYQRQAYDKSTNRSSQNFESKAAEHYELFAFDPNLADSLTLIRLGIKPFIVKNILNYRNKGGNFRTADNFKQIYSLSEEKFNELAPYIQFTKNSDTSSEYSIDTLNRSLEKFQLDKQRKTSYRDSNFVALDINRADSAELLNILGIGPYYAKQIVFYRNKLGGYYSVEQLKEINNMTDDNFEKIRHSLIALGDSLRKININYASIERMKSHPYINSFYRAKVILDLRNKNGKIKSMDDLQTLNVFTEEELLRLTPYVEFK